jgi:hypothetical protein
LRSSIRRGRENSVWLSTDDDFFGGAEKCARSRKAQRERKTPIAHGRDVVHALGRQRRAVREDDETMARSRIRMVHRPFPFVGPIFMTAFWCVPASILAGAPLFAILPGIAVLLASPLLTLVARAKPRLSEITVVGSRAVRVGSKELSAGDVRRAWTAWDGHTGELVEIDAGRDVLTASVPTRARGIAVIRALGVNDERSARCISLVAGEPGHFALCGLLLIPFAIAPGQVPTLAICCVVALLLRFTRRRLLIVDHVGVRFDGRWRRYAIAYGDLRSARVRGASMELARRKGGPLRVKASAEVEWAPVVQLIETALGERRGVEAALEDRGLFLARGSRSVGEWRAVIRALMAPSYRTATVTTDSVADVLRDGRLPAERRIGAALALRQRGGHAEVALVAQAAAAETDGELRRVLVRIAEEPLEAVEDEELERLTRKPRSARS